MPSKLIVDSDLEMLRLETNSVINYADTRNIYDKKTGNTLSYNQIIYISSLNTTNLFEKELGG